jgi:hypothetical protein
VGKPAELEQAVLGGEHLERRDPQLHGQDRLGLHADRHRLAVVQRLVAPAASSAWPIVWP